MLWFHCDPNKGNIVTGGTASVEADAYGQPNPDNLTVCVVPDGSIKSPFSDSPDFSPLKKYLVQQINDSFNAFILSLTSELVGQDRRYSKKEVEALVWTTGDEIAHPEKYPYMLAEAAAKTAILGRAVTVADVHAGVMAQLAASVADPVLEGYRVAHRQAVSEATTLPAIVAAATVDWAALMGAIGG